MSKKQELVMLSTMEAEYVAATHATKELLWLRHLIGEIFRPLNQPILYIKRKPYVTLINSGKYNKERVVRYAY